MIKAVLCTDMAKHQSSIDQFKSIVMSPEYQPKAKDKDVTLNMLFHLADISNSTKSWELCQHWTELLYYEFFNQGDFERRQGLPISFLMDRKTVNVAKSQLGFYDFVIKPSIAIASLALKNHPKYIICQQNLEVNRSKWCDLV